MKKGYIKNIETETLANSYFRRVLYTGKYSQLVLMSLNPGEDIGKEIHKHNDQFIRIEQGEGIVFINGEETPVSDDFAIVIPAGAEHNLTNTGETIMKIYTIYGPAEHKNGTIHETREIGETNHEIDHFDGETTE